MDGSVKQRLFSGGLWAVSGQVLRMLLGLISSALVARLLPVAALGAYFLAISIVDFLALVGQGGLQTAVVRVVAESVGLKNPARAKAAINLTLLGGSVSIAIVVTVFWLWGPRFSDMVFHSSLLAGVIGLIGLWAIIMTLQQLVAESFRGLHDIRLAAVFGRLLPSSLVCALFGIQWLVQGSSDLRRILILWVAASGMSVLVGIGILLRKAGRLGGDSRHALSMREMSGIAWPIAITTITLFAVAQGDLWILAMFRSAKAVASYGAALRIASMIGAPLLVVNLVLPPMIAEIFAKGDRQTLEKVLRFTATLAAIPATLVVFAVVVERNEIIRIIYGARYVDAGPVLAILSLGQLISVLAGSCGFTLTMTGHQTSMMIISAASGVVTIGLAVVLARTGGAAGVAVAATVGMALQNIAMVYAVKAKTGVWTYVGLPSASWIDALKSHRGRADR